MPMTDPRPFHDPLMQEMSLRSDINGRDYGLRIQLPPSYGHGESRYPVMFVLDGEIMFHLAADIAQIEAAWSNAPLGDTISPIPEVIVVAVTLPSDPPDPIRRNFEFMPPTTEADCALPFRAYGQKVGAMLGRPLEFGGASIFLQVVRDELLPAINANYRTDIATRILVGASAGGCFAAYVLLSEPGLFSDYIIVSPGLPAGIFRMEADWAAKQADLAARVLITAGELELWEPTSIFSGAATLFETLNHRRYPGLLLDNLIVPGANHVQTVAPSIARGLARLAEISVDEQSR